MYGISAYIWVIFGGSVENSIAPYFSKGKKNMYIDIDTIYIYINIYIYTYNINCIYIYINRFNKCINLYINTYLYKYIL